MCGDKRSAQRRGGWTAGLAQQPYGSQAQARRRPRGGLRAPAPGTVSGLQQALGPLMVPLPQLSPALQHIQQCAQHTEVSQASVDPSEVFASVESLYTDELKPYGRILRKRLAERAQALGHGQPVDIDIRQLKLACEACPWLYVQSEDGGDWSALLRLTPASFVDVYSPQDAYPAELWEAAAAYFGGLDDANMVLPGGRYSCAQVLAARQLPFLAGHSLGQICHIVQLAISQKKLLGYLNGAVVPYSRSQSMVKERCAERQRPCTSTARGTSTLANWDAVHACLSEIISSMTPGTESIPLSNMKRVFRSRFHLELSETALGYAKLSELLQDPRLRDVCAVRLQGHGYVVVPLRQQVGQSALAMPPARRSPISIADSLAVTAALPKDHAGASIRRGRPKIELSLEDIGSPLGASTVEGAAPGLPPPSPMAAPGGQGMAVPFPATPSPCSLRARSLPKLLGAGRNRLLPWQAEDASLLKGHIGSGALGGGTKCTAIAPVAIPSPAGAFGAAAARLGAAAGGAPPGVGAAAADAQAKASLFHQEGRITVPPPPPPLAPPLPLGPPPSGTAAGLSADLPPTWQGHRPLTPSTLGHLGFMIQNTFIHANMPPPTPVNIGSSCRAHSLPRNMGSDLPLGHPLATPPR